MVKVKSYVANIKAVGNKSQLFNEHALEILPLKLSLNHVIKWRELKISNPSVDLESFADFLFKRVKEIPIEWVEHVDKSKSSSSNAPQKAKRLNAHHCPQASGSEKVTSKGATPSTCFKCSGSHYTQEAHTQLLELHKVRSERKHRVSFQTQFNRARLLSRHQEVDIQNRSVLCQSTLKSAPRIS